MVLGCALVVSGCKFGVLTPAGPVGSADATIMLDSLAIMLAIVIPTIVALLVFAWWFRESNMRARYMPDFVYSGRIELVVCRSRSSSSCSSAARSGSWRA